MLDSLFRRRSIIISGKRDDLEMDLHLSFPQKGKLYKLGKYHPDNHRINTLFSQKFCDGIIRLPAKPRINSNKMPKYYDKTLYTTLQ